VPSLEFDVCFRDAIDGLLAIAPTQLHDRRRGERQLPGGFNGAGEVFAAGLAVVCSIAFSIDATLRVGGCATSC